MNQEEGIPGFCRNCRTLLQTDARFCHQCGATVAEDLKEGAQSRLFDLPKLYHVYSMVNNFRYIDIFYDNLKIIWFVVGREMPQVPFDIAISNYSELSPIARVFPENHIKEKFILEEAELLKQFLASSLRIGAVIEEIILPIRKDETGYHDSPRGMGADFFPLYKKQHYNLPFKVEGIFNIRMADERIVPDDKITVISKIPTELLNR